MSHVTEIQAKFPCSQRYFTTSYAPDPGATASDVPPAESALRDRPAKKHIALWGTPSAAD